MAREVTDADGIIWICVQAYAGLSDGEQNHCLLLHQLGIEIEVKCKRSPLNSIDLFSVTKVSSDEIFFEKIIKNCREQRLSFLTCEI